MECIASISGRLDAVISSIVPELSRSRVQKLISSGVVQVNGSTISKSSYLVTEGDVLVLDVDHPTSSSRSKSISPVDLQLPLLYEDQDCMVIDKPAGIAVHPGHSMDAHEKTLLHGISFLFHERSLPFSAASVLVHRLDKPTTGCLIIAKRPEVHMALQKQFADRLVQKRYKALVYGVPEHSEAMINAPIGRSLTDRTKMSVLRTASSREAKTRYSVQQRGDFCALLECDLLTGRTHQIRVHLSSIGHPLLGDEAYGTTASEAFSKKYNIHTLCLHASTLVFVDMDGKKVQVTSPIPKIFSETMHRLFGEEI